MKGFIYLLVLVSAALAAASPHRMPSRIMGGSPTTVEQYPYMSNTQLLSSGSFWTHWCGGSLITSWTVLSAAHCFDWLSPSQQWRVRLGSSFRSSDDASIHPVSSFILHEKYNDNTVENDIAIIRLATPAVLSSTVAVARIPASNYNLPDGTVVTAIGWGATSSSAGFAEQLQHVDINIINQQICAERYANLKAQPGFDYWPDVTDGMMCAGILDVGGADVCHGDEGGPIAFDGDIVYAITSWGYGCADPVYPGVNTRVSYYSDWVVANGSV